MAIKYMPSFTSHAKFELFSIHLQESSFLYPVWCLMLLNHYLEELFDFHCHHQ